MTAGLSTAPYSVAGVHGSRLSARHSASKTRVNALKARSGQDDIGFVPPLIPAQAGIQSHELRMCGSGSRLRGDERMGRSPRPSICISVSTHHSHNTFPLRGSVIAALLILLLPAPVKGWAERRERRVQRSRLRGASHHAYEACIAPIPNRCARLPALRLAVSVTG